MIAIVDKKKQNNKYRKWTFYYKISTHQITVNIFPHYKNGFWPAVKERLQHKSTEFSKVHL